VKAIIASGARHAPNRNGAQQTRESSASSWQRAFEVINPDPISEREIEDFAAALESEPDPFRLLAG
jgi:hypothetical protein